MKTELQKYLYRGAIGWILLAALTGAFLVTFLVFAILGNDVIWGGFVSVFAIFGLSLFLCFRSKKAREALLTDSNYPLMESDFQNAHPMRNGRVRFGQHWVFIKGKGMPLRYEDIVQIYQYIHKTNFIENERSLKYVNSKGKTRVLCQLELRGKSDTEVAQIVGIIHSQNPSVKIGYH